MRLALDTAVFVYAVGRDHPLKAPSIELLRRLRDRESEADVSVETLQEFVHVRVRGGVARGQAVKEAQQILAFTRVHDLDMAIFQVALRLYTSFDGLGVRDAIHAATALSNVVDGFVSPDTDFDGIPGLDRLTPEEALALL